MIKRFLNWLSQQLETKDDFGSAPTPTDRPTTTSKIQPEGFSDIAQMSLAGGKPDQATIMPLPKGNSDPLKTKPQQDSAAPYADRAGDIRRSIVNVLEYTYGTFLTVVLFCLFLVFADPATEVLIGFMSDSQHDAIFGRHPDTATENLPGSQFWLDSYKLSMLSLLAFPIIAHMTALGTMRLHKWLYGSREIAEAAMLKLIPLACLAAYVAAFSKAIYSEEGRVLELQPTFLLIVMLVVLLAYTLIAAFFHQVKGMLGLILVTVLRSQTQRDSHAVIAVPIFLVGALCFALGYTAYIGFFDPESHERLGPVAITTSFFILLCIGLTTMTMISMQMPGNFPLVLLIPAFAVATTSLTASIVVTLIMILGIALTLKFGGERKGRGIFVFAAAACFAGAYIYGHTIIGACKTLAGCNVIQGINSYQAPYKSVKDTLPHLPDRGNQPLRIVAAQGGGLYAAYHTAYYLAARADLEPDFADSLYAVSGVSGGSVGAGVFWAVENSNICGTPASSNTCRRDAVNEILRQDYLTASLATMFFRDFLDSLVPISALWHARGSGPIDRGRVLEREVEIALSDWLASNGVEVEKPLSLAMSDSAIGLRGMEKTTADGSPEIATPLLFLNATRVDNGTKILAAPVEVLRDAPANLRLLTGKEFSVLNGMVTSARFPAGHAPCPRSDRGFHSPGTPPSNWSMADISITPGLRQHSISYETCSLAA